MSVRIRLCANIAGNGETDDRWEYTGYITSASGPGGYSWEIDELPQKGDRILVYRTFDGVNLFACVRERHFTLGKVIYVEFDWDHLPEIVKVKSDTEERLLTVLTDQYHWTGPTESPGDGIDVR